MCESSKYLAALGWGIMCPSCHDDLKLDVAVKTFARLTDDGTDAFESADGDHEWDDTSAIVCRECGHAGTVLQFKAAARERMAND